MSKSWRRHLESKGLSAREIEVANKVMGGGSNRMIARDLFLGEKTVKFHLTAVYKKLDIHSRGELMALRMGTLFREHEQ